MKKIKNKSVKKELNKKEKREIMNMRDKIKKTNLKFVKMMKNPPMKKLNTLINIQKNIKDTKDKKKTIKARKELKKKENKMIPELFVKLETENVESYKIRKKFIENNLPKTNEEYKKIISLSIVLVNKIFYQVKYNESIEKVLKDKLEKMNLSKELKNKYFINI